MPNGNASKPSTRGARTGACGGRTSPSAPGARCARTTARTARAWEHFDHDQARSRAYRWNEDGLGGISDEQQRLCFALALWNGRDPILKERAFGLTGNQGNHGEDVKEYYFYLDATPSPQLDALPLQVSAGRVSVRLAGGREPPPLAAGSAVHAARHRRVQRQPLLRRRGALRQGLARRDPHPRDRHQPRAGDRDDSPHPARCGSATTGRGAIRSTSPRCARSRRRRARSGRCRPSIRRWAPTTCTAATRRQPLYTENESNAQRLWNVPNATPYVKDAFHRRIVNGEEGAVNPDTTGTKFGAWHDAQRRAGPVGDHRPDAVARAARGAVRQARSDLRQARSRSRRVLRGAAARGRSAGHAASCARRSPA